MRKAIYSIIFYNAMRESRKEKEKKKLVIEATQQLLYHHALSKNEDLVETISLPPMNETFGGLQLHVAYLTF
jgi:hypothetical protein